MRRILSKLLIAGFFTLTMAFMFSGTAQALDATVKDVVVTDNGATMHYQTTSETLNGFMKDKDIVINTNDAMTVTTSKPVTDSNILKTGVVTTVVIARAIDVTVDIGGETSTVNVPAGTPLGRLFLDMKAQYGGLLENKADPSQILRPGQTVYFTKQIVKNIVARMDIPFDTQTVDDPTLPAGTDTVTQEGVPGEKDIRYSVVYSGDQEISRTKLDETVVRQPADKIINHGTKVKPADTETVVKGRSFYKKASMLATAYYAGSCGKSKSNPGYGITATGTRAARGTIAVDPSVIPLGTRLYVEGYGEGVAVDTGVFGSHVDLFMDSYSECMQFGSRHVNVYFLS